ncbi:hypothetical protein T190611E02C_11121 [Tenacibaculum sp. 190524A05c]
MALLFFVFEVKKSKPSITHVDVDNTSNTKGKLNSTTTSFI